jgi:formate dehydrogenase assembly factor FdhD
MSKDRSLEWVEYTMVNAEVTEAKERVVTEIGLSIIINGRHFATAMITPYIIYLSVYLLLWSAGAFSKSDVFILSKTVSRAIARCGFLRELHGVPARPSQ